MITLAISSIKGGVGKTTCAINLAFSLAKRGWKTLLMDTDPQGSVGLSLSDESSSAEGFYEIISAQKPLSEVVLKTQMETLSILMGGKIPSKEISRWSSSLQDGIIFQPFLHQVADAGYDLLIVDTPSGVHGPTEGVLRQASHVLIPQQCEPLALRCLMQMIDFLEHLQGEGSHAILSGVILTMVNQDSEESIQVKNEITSLLPSEMVCSAIVPRDAMILKASMHGLPLGLLNGSAPPLIALTFDQLAAEIEPKIGLVRETSKNEHIPFVVR